MVELIESLKNLNGLILIVDIIKFISLNTYNIGHLNQPIAFETWSEFKNECGKSGEINNNPKEKILVKLGLKPTRLLNVDSDHNVRYNLIETGLYN